MRRLINAVSSISGRARWSLIDQALVSGVSFLTGIILVRTLGLQEFGVFSFVIIGTHLAWGIQGGGVTGPMMSLFDQRGSIAKSSYLAAVLLHQAVLCIFLALLVCLTPLVFPQIRSFVPVDFGLVAVMLVAFQFQDMSRRFFYVTERPARAFLSDVLAYGVRLGILAFLAAEGALTLDQVWIVTAATSSAAFLLLCPDFVPWNASWSEIKEVTRRHLKIAGWLTGNIVTSWPVDISFILLIVGTAVGPVQLGAARAVQNIVNLANLLIQALENFVPSAAARSLLGGGPQAMLRYVKRMSLVGAVAILLMTATLMLFADPILYLVYGRTFPDALGLIAVMGSCVALGHVDSIIIAGLRALVRMRAAFFAQAVAGVISLSAAVPVGAQWGLAGALTGLLMVRVVLTGVLAFSLARHLRPAVGGR